MMRYEAQVIAILLMPDAPQDNAKTLALSLTQLAAGTDNYINYAALTAGGVLVMAPVLIIYLIFQKNFIESVAKSGLKG